MKIKLEVNDQILSDVIGGASIGYWANLAECTFDGSKPFPARFTFNVVENGDGPPVTHKVTPAKLARAIQLIAENRALELGDVVGGYEHGQADAHTGDTLLQFAIFGELKYG